MALQDWRVASLIQYAMKVEKAMFETATSLDEYYQLLAEKICQIRMGLQERLKENGRKKKMRGGCDLLIISGAYECRECM